MNKNILTIFSLFAATLFFQGSVAFAAISSDDVVEFVNLERTKAGLPLLERNSVLDRVAAGKSLDMDQEKYFAHTSPDGVTPWHWFRTEKYEYRYAGENLAIHFQNALSQHRAWMESVKHCENILSPKYAEIGVSIRDIEWEGKMTTVAVQAFGTKLGQEEKLSQKNVSGLCPKVLSTSIASVGGESPSSKGFVGNILMAITDRFDIETGRVLALFFFGLAQAVGVFVVMVLVYQGKAAREFRALRM